MKHRREATPTLGPCHFFHAERVSVQSLPAAEKPEACTVGAVFPGLPGYRPPMKGRLPYNVAGDASAARKSVPYESD